jgi:hypothetical protein
VAPVREALPAEAKVSSFPLFRQRPGGLRLCGVPEFLVEVYLSRASANEAVPGPEDVSRGAGQLTREGKPVRLAHSIFVPEEEVCFYLFEAASVEAVREAATRAGLRFERVQEVILDWTTPSSGSNLRARSPHHDQGEAAGLI